VSLTSGTLFAETKLPPFTWFLAIYVLTQHKNVIEGARSKIFLIPHITHPNISCKSFALVRDPTQIRVGVRWTKRKIRLSGEQTQRLTRRNDAKPIRKYQECEIKDLPYPRALRWRR
jgi:hypothetical protein